jgi:hypothetical protein
MDLDVSEDEIDVTAIRKAVNLLNSQGIVLDEDGTFIGSERMERYRVGVLRLLRKHGYQGGSLESAAEFFPDWGAVYAVFDADQLEDAEARNYLRRHHARQTGR